MRDFGFGVLHTALLRSGSPRSSPGGSAYRPFAAGPPATPFGPLSPPPPPLPVTGFSEAASPFAIPSGGGAASSAAASSSSPLFEVTLHFLTPFPTPPPNSTLVYLQLSIQVSMELSLCEPRPRQVPHLWAAMTLRPTPSV